MRHAFTLIELLVTMVILGILATLTLSGWHSYLSVATRAKCSNNLRQLSSAVALYLGDHNNYFPAYLEYGPNGSRKWYFGNETTPAGTSEGNRNLEISGGPLYPYIQTVGGIEVCQGFDYGSALWKPKFKGASYGYGYNWVLGGCSGGQPMNASQVGGAGVMLFGDCGQVNTFQKPASPKKPMVEEFYLINETDKTVHFRHNNKANILFVDGHVEVYEPYPGTEDRRVKGELFGRITPVGSTKFLK